VSEPDQIVIPKSWAEFRERFLAWYHARRAFEVNCSIYLYLLGAFIVFMICFSFPDSTTAKLINAVNGILASCAVALISVNHIVKREDRYGRKDNFFSCYGMELYG
jgi:hypothetical protein